MPNKPLFIRNTVIASHLLLTGYGHWRPNDPRGSGSEVIRQLGLEQLGPIHFGRKRVQPARAELVSFYREAELQLAHPTIWFDEQMRSVVADAIGQTIRARGWTMYACAIVRNHLLVVVRTHRDKSIEMLEAIAQSTWAALHDAQLVPTDHPVWANRPYKVYLKTRDAVLGRIDYVERNPEKEGLPRQIYSFVTPFR